MSDQPEYVPITRADKFQNQTVKRGLRVGFESHEARANRRTSSMMDAA